MENLVMPREQYTVEPTWALEEGFNLEDRGHQLIDALEAVLVKLPQRQSHTVHRFTPGLYSRECFTPAMSLLTSRIHATEHPFIISMGAGAILEPGKGWVRFMSPHFGITKRGTRRVVQIFEDTICTTFHATTETDLARLDALLYLAHDGPVAHYQRQHAIHS